MSEEQYQILWNKAMKSYGAVGRSNKRRDKRSNRNSATRMLQYKRTEPWSASERPLNFNHMVSNFGMEQNYKNGVVTITEPGIYLIQSSLYNRNANKNSSHQLIKDHQIKILDIFRRPWITSELTHIMYLDFLDTIEIRLAGGGPHSHLTGYFSVIKMD